MLRTVWSAVPGPRIYHTLVSRLPPERSPIRSPTLDVHVLVEVLGTRMEIKLEVTESGSNQWSTLRDLPAQAKQDDLRSRSKLQLPIYGKLTNGVPLSFQL